MDVGNVPIIFCFYVSSVFMYICARFAQDSLPMRNICARFAQDCSYFSNAQYMRKICARLYFFPQCAIYVQDLRKIVLLSPMRNICTRFAQDCGYFSNAQYMQSCDTLGQSLRVTEVQLNLNISSTVLAQISCQLKQFAASLKLDLHLYYP